ncbi:hypothetical protein GCM10010207_41490 [Streptomyces atratus]|nr:hypothetical protein GCM10010207_41490 [Streptomyces atratus]
MPFTGVPGSRQSTLPVQGLAPAEIGAAARAAKQVPPAWAGAAARGTADRARSTGSMRSGLRMAGASEGRTVRFRSTLEVGGS